MRSTATVFHPPPWGPAPGGFAGGTHRARITSTAAARSTCRRLALHTITSGRDLTKPLPPRPRGYGLVRGSRLSPPTSLLLYAFRLHSRDRSSGCRGSFQYPL